MLMASVGDAVRLHQDKYPKLARNVNNIQRIFVPATWMGMALFMLWYYGRMSEIMAMLCFLLSVPYMIFIAFVFSDDVNGQWPVGWIEKKTKWLIGDLGFVYGRVFIAIFASGLFSYYIIRELEKMYPLKPN